MVVGINNLEWESEKLMRESFENRKGKSGEDKTMNRMDIRLEERYKF